ncbi:TPA: asparagine synthase [Candidatus Bathyarchaeota archaeon]|nr:asparagine synthase [Candidatus Bathyarchaeota archaeon]
MEIAKNLIEKIYETVRGINRNELGIAFSGGVDSSILAASCKDLGKRVTLLTVGFSSLRDIEVSKETSEKLGLPMTYEVVSLEELEDGIKSVLNIIKVDRLVLLENSVCFYYVFKIASKRGIETVLSANGMDELFCGYNLYRKYFGDEKSMKKIMGMLVETAKRDKAEMDKIAVFWNVNYKCPFLSDSFVDFAMKIPLQYKIKDENDELRKHILREAALKIEVPKSAAMRRKKAFQYSSGIHKAIAKLARSRGYTKKKSKVLGYSGVIEAYLKSLASSCK